VILHKPFLGIAPFIVAGIRKDGCREILGLKSVENEVETF